MNMKYIVINKSLGGPCAIVFDKMLSHCDVAAGKKVLSAGFVDIWGETQIPRSEDIVYNPIKLKAVCYGESITLKIKSNPEGDQRLVERFFKEW